MFAGNLFEKQAFINIADTPAEGLLFLDMPGLLIIIKSIFIYGEVYADLRISM